MRTHPNSFSAEVVPPRDNSVQGFEFNMFAYVRL